MAFATRREVLALRGVLSVASPMPYFEDSDEAASKPYSNQAKESQHANLEGEVFGQSSESCKRGALATGFLGRLSVRLRTCT